MGNDNMNGGPWNVPPQGNMNGGPWNVPPQGNVNGGSWNVPPQGNMNRGLWNVPPQGNMNGGSWNTPPQGYMNGGPRNAPPRKINRNESSDRIRIVGVPVMIYSLICAAFLYKNWSSILSVLLSLISVFFISSLLVRYERHIDAKSGAQVRTASETLHFQTGLIPYYVLVILMSAACCMTDDGFIVFGCNVGIIACELYALMKYFNNTSEWGIFKGILSFIEVFFAPVGYINESFADRKAANRESGRKRNPRTLYILLGIAIAIPILVIVLRLLAAADPVFKQVVNDLFGKIFFSWDIVGIALFFCVIYLYVYGVIVKATKRDLTFSFAGGKRYDPVVGTTITIVLTAFYLLFVVVQIVYLFTNNGTLPDGVTYSEYARNGFFQLLFVAVINVLMVMIFDAIFAESAVLKTVLVMMSACTYVMIASSVFRMTLYIKAYSLTYLRLNTLWALTAAACVLAGVIIKMFIKRFPLFGYVFVVVAALFTAYAFVRPQAVIANYNLSHTNESGKVDIDYIFNNLGNDAIPYLTDYLTDNNISPDTTKNEVREKAGNDVSGSYFSRYSKYDTDMRELLTDFRDDNDEKGYIRSFNFSRYRATVAVERYLE